MKIVFIAVSLMLLLSGCAEKKDPDYYLQHPDKLVKEYRYCNSLPVSKAEAMPDCVAAKRSFDDIRQYIPEAVNGMVFGNKILQAQIELAQLVDEQDKLHSNDPKLEEIQKSIEELKHQIAARFAVLRLQSAL